MIDIQPHADGAVLPIRAQPAAAKSAVGGELNGRLKVSITQVAEKGKANKALIKFLAGQLQVRRSQLALISGETSQEKLLLVRGISAAEVAGRVDRLLNESGCQG